MTPPATGMRRASSGKLADVADSSTKWMALLRATTPAPVQMPHADATKSTLASGSRMRSSRSSFAAVALRHSTLPERRRRGPRPRRRVVPQQQRRHATRRARVATAILLAQSETKEARHVFVVPTPFIIANFILQTIFWATQIILAEISLGRPATFRLYR